MPYDYNKRLTGNSKSLRKNMTPEERHLWYDFLRLLPVTVNRQKMIGDYIVDFYIHSKKLVIELDGIQHRMVEHENKDMIRDKCLSELGIKVLRYNNKTVNNDFSFVCNDILKHLEIDYSSLKKI